MDQEERLKAALADRYRIEREIGSGGMATVYLAQDLKHDRKVAVKVLKPELAAVVGTERFLAEIRTTANLNHAHILPLFDSGEADGFLFYVMPYVEGESLRQRLDRDGQLPVEEAVRIAGHVADALDYAHQQGVIHRDIKPGNILFQAGDPVVADFGIALAVSAAGEGRLTETGLSLGTPYYVSPEQASGQHHLSPASDVYSLGCVLYEMLTGDPPHMGSSPQAILGKILLGEVTRPTQLRPTIPANVEGAVLKALERLPADRFESATELGAALKDKSFQHGVGAGAASGGLWKWLAVTSTVVAVATVATLLTLSVRPGSPLPPASLNEIQLPGKLGFFQYWGRYTEIARDGSSMVYADTVGTGTRRQYWVKDRGSLEGRPLRETAGAYGATYSPDGAWIVYAVGTVLFKSPLQGAGQVRLLEGVRADGWYFHPLWLSDGTILLNLEGGALVRIPAEGSAPPDTVFAFPEDYITWVQDLPGREAVLVVGCKHTYCTEGTYLSVVDLKADTTWVLLEDVLRAWYTPTGHLLYVDNNGAVFAAPFDLDRLEMSATHEPMFESVQREAYAPHMVMAQDGTVIYREILGGAWWRLVWMDRAGHVDPDWRGVDFTSPALSPDGRRLAVNVTEEGGEGSQIWVRELPSGPGMQVTSGEGWRASPAWSPDGTTITYMTSEGGNYDLCSLPSDGRSEGSFEVLLDLERSVGSPVYTPDGKGMVFTVGSDIGYLDLTTGEITEDFLATESREGEPALSPDGKWMAYTSNRTGGWEVYVRPFPDVLSDVQLVSTNGGRYPLWSSNGRELFYRGGDGSVMVATYSADSVFTVMDPQKLFDPGFSEDRGWRDWDYSLSGDRFVMVSPIAGGHRMILIQNFFTELEEKVGGRR